jgi:Ion channel
MLLEIVTSTGVLLATIGIHGLAVVLLFRTARRLLSQAQHRSLLVQCGMSCVFVIGFLVAHLVEIVLWAAAYRMAGELQSFEEAVYFSAVTFATIGYGDVTLSDEWRLASAVEGVNGILLFGWTTAFLFKTSEFLWAWRGISHRNVDQV